jgi:protein-disulfide isomerase
MNKGTIFVTMLLAALAGAGAVVAAEKLAPVEPVNVSDRVAVEKIVREYILTHPEILPEAMENLQNREMAKAVATNRKQIETPFGGAWQGADDGDVTLVQFFDYACSYCRGARADVERLLAEDKKLKVVYREFPILGQSSVEAAKTSLAIAKLGGNYGAFHHAMYGGGQISAASINSARALAGVDPVKTGAEAKSPEVNREIEANLALQQELRISGTPAWVVGDRVLNGAVGYDELKKAIEQARQTK